MKKCTRCGKLKEKTQFHYNKRSKDGYDYSCKKCMNKYKRDYKRKYNHSNNIQKPYLKTKIVLHF